MLDRIDAGEHHGDQSCPQEWLEAHNNEIAALTRRLLEARRGRADAERRAASLDASLIRHAMALSDALAQLRASEASAMPSAYPVLPPLPECDPVPQAAVFVTRAVPPTPRRWLTRLLAAADRR